MRFVARFFGGAVAAVVVTVKTAAPKVVPILPVLVWGAVSDAAPIARSVVAVCRSMYVSGVVCEGCYQLGLGSCELGCKGLGAGGETDHH